MSRRFMGGLAILATLGGASALRAQSVTFEGGKYLAVDRDTAKSELAGAVLQFDGDSTYWIEVQGNGTAPGSLSCVSRGVLAWTSARQ